MELSKCYIECAKIDSSFRDSNGNFRNLVHKQAKFEIKIIKVYPEETQKDSKDFVVIVETHNPKTNESFPMNLETLNQHYVLS